MAKTFINDDEYANLFGLGGGKARAIFVNKSKKELEDTKSELQKTKEEVEKLKSDKIKVAEQQTPNLPITQKSKLPLIIGGALVFVIATFVLIKKLR